MCGSSSLGDYVCFIYGGSLVRQTSELQIALAKLASTFQPSLEISAHRRHGRRGAFG